MMALVMTGATLVALRLRDETLRSATRELKTVSGLIAERTSQTLSAADILSLSIVDLARSAERADGQDFGSEARTEGFYKSLVGLRGLLPQVDVAAVFDSDGALLATTRSYPAPDMAIGPRETPVNQKDIIERIKEKSDIGPIIIAPYFSAKGQWMFYILRPLRNSHDLFFGYVLVGITCKYFEDYFSNVDIGDTQAIFLIDGDFRVIARAPHIDGLTGAVLPRPPAEGKTDADGAAIVAISGSDGERRLAADSPVPVRDTTLYVAVSQSQAALLQPWRGPLVWIAAFATTSMIILAALMGFILQAIGKEERWSRALLERETELSKQASELAEARDVAEAANRVRSDFLANISHELRTPLNAILGFSEILDQELYGPLGDERYKDFVRDIISGGRTLLDLITGILDLTKVDAGRLKLDETDIDMTDLMDISGRMVAEAARTAGVALDITTPAEPVAVRGDLTRMKQVLVNLLSNAIKFTPAGGRVVLTGEATPDGFLIKVSDTGIGMTAEEAAQALQPFRQIDSSIARRYEGAGLGLPLANALVLLHDGALTIDSAPGRGTTVSVRLPKSRSFVGGWENAGLPTFAAKGRES